MPINVLLTKRDDLSEGERAENQALLDAVYPPGELAAWPGRHLEWARAQWCARVLDENAKLLSYSGIVLREATYDGSSVRVGGVGGVKTHPAVRGNGYAELGVGRAVEFFCVQPDVAFALLVCEPRLIGYYSRLGWQEFGGRLMVRQHGIPAEFTLNRIMTLGIRSPAPASGTIDLCGPPW